jgi:putative Ca2+/H+ antiporter (TMEM165/GDT1 family)
MKLIYLKETDFAYVCQIHSPVQPLLVPRASSHVYPSAHVQSGSQSSRRQKQQQRMTLSNSNAPRPSKPSSSSKAPNRTFTSITKRTVSLAAAVVLSTAAASLFTPFAANAINLSAISSGAVTTPVWMSSLSETGFYQAFSLVFLSEIGDKTFFIAGLLSAKTSRIISFLGSMAALAAMTLVSVAIGQVFHAVPDGFANGFPLDDAAACLAFLFFGIKTLKEAFDMAPGESVMDEEFADAQEAVEGSESVKQVTPWGQLASIFGLVFAAEFGDRSFLSTIALSAAQNPVAVAGGAIAGHAVATGIAVSGGAVLAKYLSERVLGFIGGTLFIVFAITTGLGIF